MPHGALALHTWKVDMTGESLAGGGKKRKRKRKKIDTMQTYNSTQSVHTFMSVTHKYGEMDL